MLKSLAVLAARRLASDPKLRRKAKELADTHARPLVERKARAVHKAVTTAEPGTHPARIAGRAVRKLIDG
ncbi:MAG: hypothetical protein GDA41_12150 [Rhodospirillales bacterium]|nr:hypothetical protein [Rhodospirillales bacterium]